MDNERRGVLSRAIGRVSCVDSTGTKIILDDHVQVIDSNEVSDYLTPFSGIKSDDLDAQKSTKYLTTLKRLLNAEMRRIYDIVPNGGGASPMKSVSPANSMPDGKCI
ncbi:unnamed protein product [Caenorhabditis angaria]|uniref:Uncharacterized protein n=1 Tax=Caenorhabditis angaria TaxID=860376 RepID=A0A9P1IGW8_9PELO|nr:unnamed protein product [Caenorhabditis angaria]